MLTTVLFDLDGTLLPMDQDVFVRDYFHRLAKKVAPLGYDPKALVDTVWAGTAAMVKNDGSQTNEEAFWRVFADRYGAERLRDRPAFDEFYRTDFQQTAQVCGRDARRAPRRGGAQSHGTAFGAGHQPDLPAHGHA